MRKAAKLLGIDEGTVVVLEQIIHDEQQLKKRRAQSGPYRQHSAWDRRSDACGRRKGG